MKPKKVESTPEANEFLLARQPIFDQKLDVYGYELLFRDPEGYTEKVTSSDEATYSVVLNTFSALGLDNVVGSHNAFINITEELILNPLPIAPEKIFYEIVEPAQKPELLPAIQVLAKQGFAIALDNFEFFEGWEEFAKIASIVKLDLHLLSEIDLKEYVKRLQPYNVKLLATKVETHQQFDICTELGFEYFQGHFFSKPKLISGVRSQTNQIVALKLLSELSRADVHIKDIEQIISMDPKLGVKLLKIINSSSFIKVSKIDSLKQAIVYMGLQKLKEWVSVLVLQSVKVRTDELLRTTLVRAKMCETLAELKNQDNLAQYFTAGLFSNLDAMFDLEMEGILGELNLSEKLNKAIVAYEGPIGEVLSDVIHYEKGEWDELSNDYTTTEFYDAYYSSLTWTMDMFKELN